MKEKKEALLLRVFIGEKDRDKKTKKLLYKRIVEILKENNIAGATVLRGILGYGASSKIHEFSILSISEDLPVVIEAVDEEDKIKKVIPKIEEILSSGLITTEKVNVVVYVSEN
ncbi:MAG: DUF190 domain-containing protein [Aquificae bacterium]|nr:DUF190 domain-containing protein [Aquificota bacterium]